MIRWLFFLVVLISAWKYYSAPGEIHHDPGILVREAPRQTAIASPAPFNHAGYRITPLASFDLGARVLARKSYRFDRGSDLSPLDLALGWGLMSDESILEEITIEQRSRWYHWRAATLPVPAAQISRHSANMHMIPAGEDIADSLQKLRIGEIVRIRGYLVEATSEDGFAWKSSLTRDDTGSRSCELVWVEKLDIVTH